MSNCRFLSSFPFFIVFVALSFPPHISAVLDTNLVLNGGCESDVDDWTVTEGLMMGFLGDVGGKRGSRVCRSNAVFEDTVAQQIIDISDEATGIDQYRRMVEVSAWLGSDEAFDVTSKVVVTFLVASTSTIEWGHSATAGPVTVVDRNAMSILLFRSSVTCIKPGARFAKVSMYLNGDSAMADDVSVQIHAINRSSLCKFTDTLTPSPKVTSSATTTLTATLTPPPTSTKTGSRSPSHATRSLCPTASFAVTLSYTFHKSATETLGSPSRTPSRTQQRSRSMSQLLTATSSRAPSISLPYSESASTSFSLTTRQSLSLPITSSQTVSKTIGITATMLPLETPSVILTPTANQVETPSALPTLSHTATLTRLSTPSLTHSATLTPSIPLPADTIPPHLQAVIDVQEIVLLSAFSAVPFVAVLSGWGAIAASEVQLTAVLLGSSCFEEPLPTIAQHAVDFVVAPLNFWEGDAGTVSSMLSIAAGLLILHFAVVLALVSQGTKVSVAQQLVRFPSLSYPFVSVLLVGLVLVGGKGAYETEVDSYLRRSLCLGGVLIALFFPVFVWARMFRWKRGTVFVPYEYTLPDSGCLVKVVYPTGFWAGKCSRSYRAILNTIHGDASTAFFLLPTFKICFVCALVLVDFELLTCEIRLGALCGICLFVAVVQVFASPGRLKLAQTCSILTNLLTAGIAFFPLLPEVGAIEEITPIHLIVIINIATAIAVLTFLFVVIGLLINWREVSTWEPSEMKKLGAKNTKDLFRFLLSSSDRDEFSDSDSDINSEEDPPGDVEDEEYKFMIQSRFKQHEQQEKEKQEQQAKEKRQIPTVPVLTLPQQVDHPESKLHPEFNPIIEKETGEKHVPFFNGERMSRDERKKMKKLQRKREKLLAIGIVLDDDDSEEEEESEEDSSDRLAGIEVKPATTVAADDDGSNDSFSENDNAKSNPLVHGTLISVAEEENEDKDATALKAKWEKGEQLFAEWEQANAKARAKGLLNGTWKEEKEFLKWKKEYSAMAQAQQNKQKGFVPCSLLPHHQRMWAARLDSDL